MSFKGFLKGLILAVLLVGAGMAAARYFGLFPRGADPEAPDVLAAEALNALDAVKRRQPTDRRPASYDKVMAPLDKLLSQARNLLQSDAFNPVTDAATIRSLTLPVIEIATQARAQARTETGPLAKEYRFGDQIGEACFYLASALWERASASVPRRRGALDGSQPPPAGDMNEVRKYVDMGIDEAPDNRDLWYLRGVINRAEGLYAPAARDLERAIAVDDKYAAAWNVLGLVRIALHDPDGAESALERARALALEEAQTLGRPPGQEYAAIIYNLADLHDNLSVFYARENRNAPTVEAKRMLTRHTDAARQYYQEYLKLFPDSPDVAQVRERLASLGR